jgi:parallel beta-helix repeat protein
VPAVASGATVSLACGQVYRGTLELSSKSNITINVSGTCGKPTIVPNAGQNGINAISASTIRIDGVKIQGAARGININNAKSITINNVDILKSSDSGIYASGIVGMNISNSSISDSGNTGIDGGSWVVNGVVTNTTITRSGANGGNYNGIGIYFGDGHDNNIDHVSVSNSVYHGIVVLHNSYTSVTNSLVTSSCTGPDHDCGSIYTGARDKLPLNLQIAGNSVSGSSGIGIYLDDYSNGVTVNGNSVTQTLVGISLHNGFNNTIINNYVFSNRQKHLGFGQDSAGAIYGNKVNSNTFKTTNGELTHSLETGEVRGFATFDYNAYIGTAPAFARTWAGGSAPGIDYSYSSWKSYMGQDAHSTMNGVP